MIKVSSSKNRERGINNELSKLEIHNGIHRKKTVNVPDYEAS